MICDINREKPFSLWLTVLIGHRGASTMECAAIVPVVAAFILIVIQLSAAFTRAASDVARTEAAANHAIIEWSMAQDGHGLHRPCLEEMPVHSVTIRGESIVSGAGVFRRNISAPQEVHIVDAPICSD